MEDFERSKMASSGTAKFADFAATRPTNWLRIASRMVNLFAQAAARLTGVGK